MPPDCCVYIVDDEPSIRDSLAMLLRSVDLPSVTYADAPGFLAGYRPGARDCLIADVRMPGMSGIELLEVLRTRAAMLPVIIITGHGDIAMAVRAMKNGAADFIEKPFHDQTLLDAVHRALARHTPAGGAHGSAASDSATFHTLMRSRLDTLSPREREVFLLVAAGSPNKVVATRLGLSTRTVEVHRAKVMEKMRANSLPDLVRAAIACRLLDP